MPGQCNGKSHLKSSAAAGPLASKANRPSGILCSWNVQVLDITLHHGAHGVVASHPLRMRKALGSNPSVSKLCSCSEGSLFQFGRFVIRPVVAVVHASWRVLKPWQHMPSPVPPVDRLLGHVSRPLPTGRSDDRPVTCACRTHGASFA